MIRETHTFSNEEEWLAARKLDVTSTEAAALFNAGAYVKTFYELYNLKAGIIKPKEFVANTRTVWGSRLEPAIAYGMAEDLGLIVEPFKCYMRIPEIRAGSSFDFKVIGLAEGYSGDETYRDLFRKYGPGVMECKSIDGLQFKRNWLDDGESFEATPQIEFQVAHQLEISDLEWAVIAPLVAGNTPRPAYRIRDRHAGEAIRNKCAELWQRINAGAAPDPDFSKDAETIAAVYRDNDGSSVDLSDDNRLAELCRIYKSAGADEKAAKERKDAAKAEILTIVKHAKSIAYANGKISAGTNKESFRAYWRDESERISISLTTVKGAQIEATVAPFRNVRITEAA